MTDQQALPPSAPAGVPAGPAAPLSTVLYDAAKALGGGRGGLGPARLRQVQVATRDPATLTCEVYLDGDTSVAVPCGLLTPAAVPVINQWGWALQNDTDLQLIGTAAGLPKIKARSAATGAVTSEEDWDFAVGAVEYDTDWDGTNGIFNSAGGNFIVRWPGKYAFGAKTFIIPSAGSIVVLLLIQATDGSGKYYDASQDISVGTNGIHLHTNNERFFNAGDGLQLRVRSSGGSSTFGDASATHELGTSFWMHYIP